MIIINEPYFLSVCVPVKIDRNGTRWCNELWAKDLALHIEYLSDLTVACPRIFAEPLGDDRSLNVAPFDRLKFIDLPCSTSHVEALVNFPELLSKMWRGIKPAMIVHAGFGGWPISEGWLAIPLGKLQGKFVISYVESSPWRISGSAARWHRRLRGFICENLTKFCVRIADLRFFTSKAYRDEFTGRAEGMAERAYVAPATWIDEPLILSCEQATQDWNGKSGKTKLLFAGRLIREKGVRLLLDAIESAENKISADITIIGDGPLADECAGFVVGREEASLKVELLKPVPYGSDFFNLLRRFDAVLLPSLSEEQPRLIFDAFSQGIPILGANTGGIIDLVEDNINGKLFLSGDKSALMQLLVWASQSRDELRTLGLSALKNSRKFTHRSMHQRRSEIIAAERSSLVSR